MNRGPIEFKSEAQKLIHGDGLIVAFRQRSSGDLAFGKGLAFGQFPTSDQEPRSGRRFGILGDPEQGELNRDWLVRL